MGEEGGLLWGLKGMVGMGGNGVLWGGVKENVMGEGVVFVVLLGGEEGWVVCVFGLEVEIDVP